MNKTFPQHWRRYFIQAALAATLLTALALRLTHETLPQFEFGFSLIFSLTHGYFALFITARAIERGSDRFFLWALGINGLRVFLLLLLLFLLRLDGRLDFMALLTGFLTGYFVFLFAEVAGLHREVMGTPAEGGHKRN